MNGNNDGMAKVWPCVKCGSSNYKVDKDAGNLKCSNCGDVQNDWQLRMVSGESDLNCINCSGPIYEILQPGFLVCPNCKKDASQSWQISLMQNEQNVKINHKH